MVCLRLLLVVSWLVACGVGVAAPLQPTIVDRSRIREIFAELVEIDTTTGTGNTATAARAMAKRLFDAGYSAAEVQVFEPKPGRGNLVARLRGTGKRKPVLLVAHLDVVPAKRTDWETDPFKLVERDGYLYGRGTLDDKLRAAAYIAALIRYKREGYRPDRDIIVALETDEETGDPDSVGITWLLAHHRDLIDAEFAINENGALVRHAGKPLYNGIQTSEKAYQSYWFAVTNGGGHSSVPRKDNAIYELAEALVRLRAHQFPVTIDAGVRRYLHVVATIETPATAKAVKALLANPSDAAAAAVLGEHSLYGPKLRTTCVATRLDAGTADGVLATSARATVNCRILPGTSSEAIRQTLATVAGPGVTVTPTAREPAALASPMNAELLAHVEKMTRKYWPGTPVVEVMSAGASDSVFLRNAGIPCFGHTGIEVDIEDTREHANNERVSVRAFETAHQYTYELVRAIAGGR